MREQVEERLTKYEYIYIIEKALYLKKKNIIDPRLSSRAHHHPEQSLVSGHPLLPSVNKKRGTDDENDDQRRHTKKSRNERDILCDNFIILIVLLMDREVDCESGLAYHSLGAKQLIEPVFLVAPPVFFLMSNDRIPRMSSHSNIFFFFASNNKRTNSTNIAASASRRTRCSHRAQVDQMTISPNHCPPTVHDSGHERISEHKPVPTTIVSIEETKRTIS